MTMEPTPDLVRAFWSHLQGQFGSSVVQKDESAVMAAAADLLSALKIQEHDQFLKLFVTTLHRTIYVPFHVGVEEDDWPLWVQMRIAVHEHQHIVQGEREGWVTFDTRYLTSSSFRAGYEAEACGCDLEMEFYKTGRIFDIKQRVSSLKNYGCSAADIEQAELALRIRAAVVVQGVVETAAAKAAIEWLETWAPGLREFAVVA